MRELYRYSIRHPVCTVLIAVLVTLAIAPGAIWLRLRTDGHALVPADAPEIRYDREVRETFGVPDPVVVLIRSDDPAGIFNTPTLELVRDLTAAFLRIADVEAANVMSLATERGHRVYPGTLEVRPFLDPLPATPAQLVQLRDDLRRIKLYTGVLVSRDGRATAVFVGAPAGVDRTELYRRIQEIIAAQGDRPEEIRVIGAPVAEALLGTHILEDLGVPEVVLGHRLGRPDDDASHWPTSLYELRRFIGRHIGLVPVALVVMMLVFAVSFRSLWAALLPMSEVGACLAVVFGLMGWCAVPVYLTIAVLPVILTAIGVADEIHIFTRYRHQLRDRAGQSEVEAVTATMDEMWVPVVKTSVTTAVGFCSFALSPMAPVRAFGIFTAVGILFCMLWSLSVIPAALTLLPSRWFRPRSRPRQPDGDAATTSILGRLGLAVVRARYAVLAAAVVVAAVAPIGVRRLVVQDSWIDGFAPDSNFYRATQLFNQQFLGTHVLLVCVNAGGQQLRGQLKGEALGDHHVTIRADAVDDPDALVQCRITLREPEITTRPTTGPGDPPRRRWWRSRIERVERVGDRLELYTARQSGLPRFTMRATPDKVLDWTIESRRFTRPALLREIEAFERFIRQQADHQVGGVLGPAAFVKTTRFILKALKESERRIPDSIRDVEDAWARYGYAFGQERLRQIVDEHYGRALITVYMTNANFVDTGRLMDDIRAYAREHLAPHGIRVAFAGDVAVSQTLIDAIVTTQVRSLLISLAGILAVTAILGRSLRWGLYCVLPCGLAVLVNFAVMGLVGMPLGVATSMFAGMTLGIGVDYAIHLLERYRLIRRRGETTEAAIAGAVAETGPAILVDALAVALSFGIMTLSQVPANARLGRLLVLSIAGCLAVTLLVLPALLRAWPPRTTL